MNPSIDRDFISQLVIVLAVCAGAWMMLVQAKASEITRLEHQIAEASQAAGLSSQDGIEALAARFADFKQNLEGVRRRNAVADDASSLYATVMQMATAAGVRVQALQPTPAREAAGGKPAPVKAARLEMTLTGSFEDIAKFIDQVAAIDAFIRPSTLQLIPIDSPQERGVGVRYTCDVLAFNIDDALVGVGGNTNVQP